MATDDMNLAMESIRERIQQIAAPTPLALSDQTIMPIEELPPYWVVVPFKTPVRIIWDWNDFLLGAETRIKNPRLAMAGLVMSWACEVSSIIIGGLFETLGFDHVWSSHYLVTTLQRNAVSNPARTFAHKAIELDGKVFHIVCAVFKGTTTIGDAITDIKSVKDGFYAAGKNCADALTDYVASIEGATDDNTILFITGHSLGAATANVVGRLTKHLADDPMRFVYTYASPNYECEGDDQKGYQFPNFRTFTNTADAVPTVPPNFPKIGIEYTYDRNAFDDETRERFETVYRHLRGVSFEEDDDPVGLGVTRMQDSEVNAVLKEHLLATYMALILSQFPDEVVNACVGIGGESEEGDEGDQGDAEGE